MGDRCRREGWVLLSFTVGDQSMIPSLLEDYPAIAEPQSSSSSICFESGADVSLDDSSMMEL